jgi:hypothetical protein
MNTEIKSMTSDRRLAIQADSATSSVSVGVLLPRERTSTVMTDRADFLTAVESELNVRLVPADAIVIERGKLPEATETPGEVHADGDTWGVSADPEAVRKSAYALLAIAARLDTIRAAKKPVNEADVEALADLCEDLQRALRPNRPGTREFARRLLDSGKVTMTRTTTEGESA